MLCLAQPGGDLSIGAEGVTVDSLYSAGADSRLTTRSELSGPGRGATAKRQPHGMDEIAKQTGGAAFYSANSLTDALHRVTGHGSNFYTLTYTSTTRPLTGNTGKFRWVRTAPDTSLTTAAATMRDDGKSTQAPLAKPATGDDLLSPFLRPGGRGVDNSFP